MGALIYLLRVDYVAQLITTGLQHLLDGEAHPELLASYLTAIPKPDRPTDVAANLRPISVSSTWYRILMRIFVARLSPELP